MMRIEGRHWFGAQRGAGCLYTGSVWSTTATLPHRRDDTKTLLVWKPQLLRRCSLDAEAPADPATGILIAIRVTRALGAVITRKENHFGIGEDDQGGSHCLCLLTSETASLYSATTTR